MTAGYQGPDILHSTDGADMDDEGHVDVTMVLPEMYGTGPLPSPDEMRYELHSSGRRAQRGLGQ
jgi:hypothetical protein